MANNIEQLKVELQEYKDKAPSNWKTNADYLFNLADKYFDVKDYDNAILFYTKSIELDPNNADAYNSKAVALYRLGKKDTIFDLYLKTLEIDKNDSITFSNIFTSVIEFSKFSIVEKIINKPVLYDYLIKHIIDYAVGVATPHKIKYFKLFDDIEISDKCKDSSEHFWVKHIFENTLEIENTYAIRGYLIALYCSVIAIKRSLLLTETIKTGIGHYTKIESIKHLVDKENSKRMRLYNVAYMNDPSEGRIFLDLLATRFTKTKKNILESYYNPIISKTNERKVLYKSETYLGSFSKNLDSLPMWVQYGNNGTGCCLVFNQSFFDKEEELFTTKEPRISSHSKDIVADSDKKADKYSLYSVIYANNIEHIKDRTEIYTNIQSISNILCDLENKILEISSHKRQEDIRLLVINILDQIRFLFKNIDYKHEEELRIVKFSQEPISDEGARARETPHLYIEMDKTLEYDEIILGPKVEKPSEIAPFLHHTEKVNMVTKSSIKYQ